MQPILPHSGNQQIRWVLFSTGCLSFLLGALVLFGWHFEKLGLIQLRPHFAPMQYNAALAFVLVGLALILFGKDSFKSLVLIIGVLVASLGIATLLQYLFAVDFGFDELFMQHYVTANHTSPGRISPNGALGWVSMGMALSLLVLPKDRKWRQPFIGLCGAILVSLGVVATFGYLYNLEAAFGWGDLTPIAFHTALGFIVLGAAVIDFSLQEEGESERKNLYWFPIVAGLTSATISICIWQALKTDELRTRQKMSEADAQRFSSELNERIEDSFQSLARKSHRWFRDKPKQNDWRSNAEFFMEDQLSARSIHFLDFERKQVWNSFSGAYFASNPTFRRTVAEIEPWIHMMETGAPLSDHKRILPLALDGNRMGYLVIIPIGSKLNSKGYVLGIFDLNHLLKASFAQEMKTMSGEIQDAIGSRIQFFSSDIRPETAVEISDDINGYQLSLKTQSRNGFLGQTGQVGLWIVLFAGIFASVFFSVVVYLIQNAKRTNQALRKSQERFELAVSGSRDGIWDWNMQTGSFYFSPNWAQKVGMEKQESLTGFEDFRSLVHPEDLSKVDQCMEEHFASDALFEIEYRMKIKDGTYRWVFTRGLAVYNEQGNPVRMAGSITDMTERKQFEDKIKRSEERFRAIYENAPIMIYAFSSDGKCQLWNRACVEVLGYEQNEVQRMEHFVEILFPDPFARRQVLKTVSQPDGKFREVQIRSRNGDWMYQRWAHFPLPDEGIISIGYDVTEQKKQEERVISWNRDLEKRVAERTSQLAQVIAREQTAIASSRMKSEFLANMSHEIRTPLNGVVGMLGLLSETKLDEKQKDYAKSIESSAQHLLTVINDILDFSKIEAGKLDVEELDFQLNETIEETAKSVRYWAEEKGLQFKMELDSNLPSWVKGDPGRLRQILSNILSNAVKFTSSGSVKLSCSLRNKETGAPTLYFEIEDTGIGIPHSTLERLFKPFSQADASTTRKFGGSGLGLSICKGLVEQMGGEIGVSSQEGKGSRFWFTLPARMGTVKSAYKPEAQPVSLAEEVGFSARVLVAEDNIVNQKIAIALLQRMGLRADAVANGKEALEALKRIPYDLVLMDCQMPEMDGYEATSLYRQQVKSDKVFVPIIALTASAIKGDREKCLEAGMNDYITKPIKTQELSNVLKTWLTQVREVRKAA